MIFLEAGLGLKTMLPLGRCRPVPGQLLPAHCRVVWRLGNMTALTQNPLLFIILFVMAAATDVGGLTRTAQAARTPAASYTCQPVAALPPDTIRNEGLELLV